MILAGRWATVAGETGRMTLLEHDREALYRERRCGEFAAEVTRESRGWVVIVCTCGAQLARRVPVDPFFDR